MNEKRRPEGRRRSENAAKPLAVESTGCTDSSAPVTLAYLTPAPVGGDNADVNTAEALGEPFTADRLRDLGVPEPSHPNYVGALFIGASKAGVIRPVEFMQSRRPSRHAGVQRVWVGGDDR